MSAAFPDVTLKNPSVSPMLADAVNQSLVHFTKVHKIMIELTTRISAIQNDTAMAMISTIDTFNKKLSDVSKDKFRGQNESYIRFIKRVIEQIENQAKVIQTLGSSFNDCVVNPLQDVVEKKKEIWRTCFHYADSFQQQIQKKELDLVKRFKDYSEAAAKFKSPENKKHQLICHNSHNTYLLRLSSVNSINKLMYTHVLPHVLYSIEQNQSELNDSLRHHSKYMFSIQKEAVKKILKSIDKIDHATAKIDLTADLNKFVKSFKAKDKVPPRHDFIAPGNEGGRRMSIVSANLEEVFIINKCTQPNLQRRLASLQYQTSELVNSISTLRSSNGDENDDILKKSDDSALNDLIELLYICDKEANLNVLLKQMELYTPDVLNFLGPIPENLMQERLHSQTSPPPDNTSVVDGQQPHEFVEPKLFKPMTCNYCSKLIIGRGFVCKACKMSVHKKCAFNVPFCGGTLIKTPKVDSSSGSNVQQICEDSIVYDLIDLDDDFYDDDEFDDGLSDEDNDLLSFSQPVLVPTPSPHIKKKTAYNNSIPVNKMPPLPKPPLSKSSSKPKISKKPSLPKKPLPKKCYCVSLYDFHGAEETDLSFTVGRKIEILNQSDSQWWEGKLDNFVGYFPCQYVMVLNENDKIYRSMYDFKPESDIELAVCEGQIVTLVEKEGDDWLKVRTLEGHGLVPTSYLERIM